MIGKTLESFDGIKVEYKRDIWDWIFYYILRWR